ncbi:mycofactocin system transcriptional regulator [Nocardioides dubius]|uniref:Mycofactocin system transcriptional regulator n=1 Tax=Nocardioides dubius TaxID=317019 RepID=A0ABP4ES13_9ACTN
MSEQSRSGERTRGRPGATSHAEIEQAAFRLFAEHGFEQTTLDAIAREVGVGKRTLFRYFDSKNDIPWGQFDQTLDHFRAVLRRDGDDVPLWQAVHRAVLEFNTFPADASPPHRERMLLILRTPALQAHSVLRYGQWRDVIAEYVAERTGCAPTELLPRTIGQVSLALALASYDTWLEDDQASLTEVLARSMDHLRGYLSD